MRTPCDGKAKYDKATVVPTDLLRELAVHPCCGKGCVTTILGLPAARGDICGCFKIDPGFAGFCAPAPSEENSSEAQQQARFLEIVKAARTPFDKFRPRADDPKELEIEKKKQLAGELLRHFKHYGRRLDDKSWNWDGAYDIRLPDGTPKKVCKRAWCAISGVLRGGVEYAQRLVREGTVAEHLVAEEDLLKDVNVKDAFVYFGMDIDTYHYYIQSFMVISAIPESGPAMVAAAWIADYFDLVGEAQPGLMALHYDPVSKREIYDTYFADEAVLKAGHGCVQ